LLQSRQLPSGRRRRRAERGWSLVWTLIGRASCVSCVSCSYSVNPVETHETVHLESGMRYQIAHHRARSTTGLFHLPLIPS
jgi:hypothetical protein